MNTPPAECLAAIRLLLDHHKDGVAIYKPRTGGLVVVIDDPETADAIASFLGALDGLEMDGAELDTIFSLFGSESEIPEA